MKKIIFITGSRAEYDIIKNLLILTKKNREIKSIFVFCGSHLNTKYGNSINLILEDKINIDYKIKDKNHNYGYKSVIKSIANISLKFSNLYEKLTIGFIEVIIRYLLSCSRIFNKVNNKFSSNFSLRSSIIIFS